MRLAIGPALLFLLPALANAQPQAPAIADSLRGVSSERVAGLDTPPRYATLGRAALGAVGLFAGAMTGAGMGHSMDSASPGCDDCFSSSAGTFTGMMLGAVAGSSLMAALPTWGSSCGFGTRVRRAVLWSAVAGVTTVSTAIFSGKAGGVVFMVGYPLGTVAGASLGASRCSTVPSDGSSAITRSNHSLWDSSPSASM